MRVAFFRACQKKSGLNSGDGFVKDFEPQSACRVGLLSAVLLRLNRQYSGIRILTITC